MDQSIRFKLMEFHIVKIHRNSDYSRTVLKEFKK